MSLSGDADEAKVFRSDSTSADNSGTCIYILYIQAAQSITSSITS